MAKQTSDGGNPIAALDALAARVRVPRHAILETLEVSPRVLRRPRPEDIERLSRLLSEIEVILGRVEGWHDSPADAWVWFRTSPLHGCAGLTPAALVRAGRVEAVHNDIDTRTVERRS